MHLGPREREQEEPRRARLGEDRARELHGREVAPLQILEDDHDGGARALGRDPILERHAHRVAHERRVRARRAERRARGARRGREHRELAEEIDDAADVDGAHDRTNPRLDLRPLRRARLALDEARRAPHEVGDHRVRRARAQRLAAAEQDRRRRIARVEPPRELVPEPRFARARGPRHERPARGGRLHALIVERLEHHELPLAADHRRRTAEQARRRGRVRLELAAQRIAEVGLLDPDKPTDEPRRRRVEHDRVPRRERPRRRAALDDVGREPRVAEPRARGRDGEPHARHARPHGEREPRAAQRLVAFGLIPAEDGDHLVPERAVRDAAELRRRELDRELGRPSCPRPP